MCVCDIIKENAITFLSSAIKLVSVCCFIYFREKKLWNKTKLSRTHLESLYWNPCLTADSISISISTSIIIYAYDVHTFYWMDGDDDDHDDESLFALKIQKASKFKRIEKFMLKSNRRCGINMETIIIHFYSISLAGEKKRMQVEWINRIPRARDFKHVYLFERSHFHKCACDAFLFAFTIGFHHTEQHLMYYVLKIRFLILFATLIAVCVVLI